MGVETFIAPATSHVQSIDWDDESEDMIVNYADGSVYMARNVTSAEWRRVQQAPVTGAFLRQWYFNRLQKQ